MVPLMDVLSDWANIAAAARSSSARVRSELTEFIFSPEGKEHSCCQDYNINFV
jgi:hypothetical protein